MLVLMYDLNVIGSHHDVLCVCWCVRSSHCCLIWSSEVFTRTPSHIWGRLYLPTFLFRVGLVTLMYMDSLIILVKLGPPCLLF